MGAAASISKGQENEYRAKIVKDDGATIDFHGVGGDEYESVTLTAEELKQVSDDYVIQLLGPSVKILNLKRCENITDKTLEEVAKRCLNLTSLNVAGCGQLTDQSIVEVAKHCPNLTSLNVGWCTELTDQSIMELAKNCPNLTSLEVSACNKLTDQSIVEVAKHCPNLTSLEVHSCNKLTDQSIMEVAKNCPNINTLEFNDCINMTDASIFAIAEHCPNLMCLNASTNKITKLPENIGDALCNLTYLHLSNNQITKLPRSITKLKITETYSFNIGNNPLQEPPLEIAKQGIAAIERYFEDCDRGGSAISTQLKVVLVGDGEVGKTSLRRAIRGDANPLTRKVSRTIHLDIERVEIRTTASGRMQDADNETKDDPPPLTLCFYDCGGQREYATGQAPFLTGSALFLLVVPADKAVQENYEQVVGRFLVLLQTRAPGAVVQLILSKTDLLDDEDNVEEKREWLLESVTDTLNEWREGYEERKNERANQIGHSNQKEQLLRIQPTVLCISIKDDPQAIAKVRDGVLALTSTKDPPLLPTVGQMIPGTWLELWKLLGAVMRHGISADDCILFEATRDASAKPLGSEKFNGSNENASAYAPVAALKNLWKRYCDANEGTTFSGTTFNDALCLLEAQGGIFVDAGLAFLHPPFVTDLMSKLIDHTLTLDYMKKSKFKKEVKQFLKTARGKGNAFRALTDGLQALVERGVLCGKALPFLWRDVSLKKEHFSSVLKMLVDTGVIMSSRLGDDVKDVSSLDTDTADAIVLFRLPSSPPSGAKRDEAWPESLKGDQAQIELQIDLWAGCPASLPPRFSAEAHKLGACLYAWLAGVFVLDKGRRRIRAELVQKNDGDNLLVLSVRGQADDALNEAASKIIFDAVDWLNREREKRLPGLEFSLSLGCPECLRRNKTGCDAGSFDWEKVIAKEQLFCKQCKDYVEVRISKPEGKEEGEKSSPCDQTVAHVTKSMNADLPAYKYSYNPAIFSLENNFPEVIFSYATKSNNGKGKDDMWALANVLRENGITSFNGYQVEAGDNWQEAFYGRLPEAQVAILVLSPEYFASDACVKECATILRESKIKIVPVQFGMPNIQGHFLGEGDDEIMLANLIKSKLGNVYPPPDQGGFHENFAQHAKRFAEVVGKNLTRENA